MPAEGPAIRTFLFTDVEGSTRRWEQDADAMAAALQAHDATLTAAVAAHAGAVFKHTGDGMCAVFGGPAEATAAAIDAQRALTLPVRMGIHTGEAHARDGDFFGSALNRCARVMDAGHGGQVLLSASAALDAGEVAVRDLGEHRLRDLLAPVRIFQLLAPGLEDSFPPLRSLEAVRHNLPVLRSSFVGRDLELADLEDRVRARQLVTLTGTGGSGKTRLALEAAAHVLDGFPDGVFFVDLAVLSDPDLLGQTVAGAIGAHIVDTSVEGLAGHLGERRALIVLDNCEHLVDACAELVDGLLSLCANVHVLATSREALAVEGEHVLPVGSLDIGSDAVRLFLDRAAAAGAPAYPESAVAGTVTEICRRLDGIPLAIELAAARAAQLPADEILARLADRFRLLTGGRRRVARQQTLHATLDWSHDLLGEGEMELFRRLAVFRGSFSLAAVEELYGRDCVDPLASLVAKSLLVLGHQDGTPRYRMLETVRAYAEEKLLASGEAAELRAAHRDYYRRWLEALPVGRIIGLGGGDELAPEAENLSAALEWSLDEGRPDLVALMAARMVGYWWSYLRMGEVASWWRHLEPHLGELAPEARAAALLVGADLGMGGGDFEGMQARSAAALRSAPPDSWMTPYAWSRQALYWTYADPERGREAIMAGRRAGVAAGVPELVTLNATWTANLLTGDPARDSPEEVRRVLESVIDLVPGAAPLNAFNALGVMALLGETEQAARLAAGIEGNSPILRYGRAGLQVAIALTERRREAAVEHLRDFIVRVREIGIPLGETSAVVYVAALAEQAGEYERASRLLACGRAAAPFPFRSPVEILAYRMTARKVRDALDSETADRCRAEGARLTVSETLDAELARLQPARAAR